MECPGLTTFIFCHPLLKLGSGNNTHASHSGPCCAPPFSSPSVPAEDLLSLAYSQHRPWGLLPRWELDRRKESVPKLHHSNTNEKSSKLWEDDNSSYLQLSILYIILCKMLYYIQKHFVTYLITQAEHLMKHVWSSPPLYVNLKN